MRAIVIVIERAGDNYSAYAPELPGCVATGSTEKKTEANMREALRLHLRGMEEDWQRQSTPLTWSFGVCASRSSEGQGRDRPLNMPPGGIRPTNLLQHSLVLGVHVDA